MKPTRLILTVLFALIPGAALAHGSEDAPLHVDPSLKDCSVQFAPGLTQSAFARSKSLRVEKVWSAVTSRSMSTPARCVA